MQTPFSILTGTMRAAMFAAIGFAIATAALAAPTKVAVVSLVGEKLEIVYPQMGTGSRLDQNVRHAINDQAGEFDRYTLAAAAREVEATDPAAVTTLIGIGVSKMRDQPELLFDGKQVALPGSWVDELVRQQADYLLLVSKHRGAVKLSLTNATTGVGNVRGLGFYIDPDTRVTRSSDGAEAEGLLAPFAYFRVSLVDVRTGLVVREAKVELMDTLPVAGRAGAKEPWHVLNSTEKVAYIEKLITQGMKAAVPQLFGALATTGVSGKADAGK